MKNTYKLLITCVFVLFLLEILIFYWINSSYYYILNLNFYLSFIVIQLFTLLIILNARKGKNIILFIYALVLITLPLLFVNSLPKYSYQEGKLLIENHFQEETYQITDSKNKTVPVSDSHSFHSWLLKDYYYYYQVTSENENYYFSVNPVNGDVYEHERDFFKERKEA